jgi:hypothetical protein
MHYSFRRTRRVFAIAVAVLVVMFGAWSASEQPIDQEYPATLNLVDAFLAARARHDFDAAAAYLADDISVILERGETRAGFDGMRHLIPAGATYTLGPRFTDANEVAWIETVVQHAPQPLLQTSRYAIIDGSASLPERTPAVERPTTLTRAMRAVVRESKITSVGVGGSQGVDVARIGNAPAGRGLLVALTVAVAGCVFAFGERPAPRRSAQAGRLIQGLNMYATASHVTSALLPVGGFPARATGDAGASADGGVSLVDARNGSTLSGCGPQRAL